MPALLFPLHTLHGQLQRRAGLQLVRLLVKASVHIAMPLLTAAPLVEEHVLIVFLN